MSDFNKQLLSDLLGHLCNGTINDEQVEQLNQILLQSSEARRDYIDYIDVHVAMVDRAQIDSLQNIDYDAVGSELAANPPGHEFKVASESTNHGSTALRWIAGLATVALVSVLANWWIVTSSLSENNNETAAVETSVNNPASTTSLDNDSATSQTTINPLFVAQLVGITDDVVWGDKFDSHEFLLRVRRGDRIEIKSGLVQLDYFSGAVLILRGPCTFVPTGNASGRIERGQLTGKVAEGDFLLTTPSAQVIDLGTEFGVSINSANETSVSVFDGEVKVVANSNLNGVETALSLTEGMAAKVDRAGGINRDGEFNGQQFVRELPNSVMNNKNEISLADLFSSTTKSRNRLAGVIAPNTGVCDQNPWLKDNGPGHRESNGFQKTSWHPFVDGVFIPASFGKNTQLDTSGNVADLPLSLGRTWGPIWSRRKPGDAETVTHEDFWGTLTLEGVVERLKQSNIGMIGMHSNVGVSFDLDAVRGGLGVEPKKFVSIIGNLDNSLKKSPEWAKTKRFTADLRVFVDGKLKASRLDFGRADGELVIEVELQAGDRFLTVVSTDAGHTESGRSDGFDHVVLIDPVLKLK